ncbi:single-stranded DNA-binding protein [Corynebacterium heidelbergense]|uniref:Single-stranded DNA-binding protein n=1 Tax=Corynebacterium heidelbergense TaxID=2055947 RepID=A0A364VDK2_9CORY|nr:single-stranded DNA-binding protein [Corynebacterium heidelbergense]RAV34742.1 hypothetical protein CWC39_01455 [Corynebacterium heidelbergense]WCZ37001.1 Single-stranded DNA-binding protein [Corynebacterium heidelbergense]
MIQHIYIEGGVCMEPELRYTQSGKAVCQLRIAASDQHKDGDEWVRDQSVYWTVAVWGRCAEPAARLTKGDRVVVRGKPVTRQWETPEGQRRSATEVQAFDVWRMLDAPSNSTPSPQPTQQQQPPQQQASGWQQTISDGDDDPPF